MHPENGLLMVTEAKNMTMVWDPFPCEFTIRSDDIYDKLHYSKNIRDRRRHMSDKEALCFL
jgi:hypothetical protein